MLKNSPVSKSSECFSKQVRLTHTNQFGEVFKQGKKIPTRYFSLFYKPNGLNHPRFGIVVSKKAVRKAVARNRIKRLFRESFRKTQQQLPEFDIVIAAYSEINKLTGIEIRQQAGILWEKLILQKRSSAA